MTDKQAADMLIDRLAIRLHKSYLENVADKLDTWDGFTTSSKRHSVTEFEKLPKYVKDCYRVCKGGYRIPGG